MASKNNPKGRENDLVVQEFETEVLIYDLTIHKAYCLNQASAMVWSLCDGNNSVADIIKQISKKLKSPVTEDFVWLALDQLKEHNLLADSKEIEIKFGTLSRREVVRKVGFASLVALPSITSLVAPTALMATSHCVQAGSSVGCTSSGLNCQALAVSCCSRSASGFSNTTLCPDSIQCVCN